MLSHSDSSSSFSKRKKKVKAEKQLERSKRAPDIEKHKQATKKQKEEEQYKHRASEDTKQKKKSVKSDLRQQKIKSWKGEKNDDIERGRRKHRDKEGDDRTLTTPQKRHHEKGDQKATPSGRHHEKDDLKATPSGRHHEKDDLKATPSGRRHEKDDTKAMSSSRIRTRKCTSSQHPPQVFQHGHHSHHGHHSRRRLPPISSHSSSSSDTRQTRRQTSRSPSRSSEDATAHGSSDSSDGRSALSRRRQHVRLRPSSGSSSPSRSSGSTSTHHHQEKRRQYRSNSNQSVRSTGRMPCRMPDGSDLLQTTPPDSCHEYDRRAPRHPPLPHRQFSPHRLHERWSKPLGNSSSASISGKQNPVGPFPHLQEGSLRFLETTLTNMNRGKNFGNSNSPSVASNDPIVSDTRDHPNSWNTTQAYSPPSSRAVQRNDGESRRLRSQCSSSYDSSPVSSPAQRICLPSIRPRNEIPSKHEAVFLNRSSSRLELLRRLSEFYTPPLVALEKVLSVNLETREQFKPDDLECFLVFHQQRVSPYMIQFILGVIKKWGKQFSLLNEIEKQFSINLKEPQFKKAGSADWAIIKATIDVVFKDVKKVSKYHQNLTEIALGEFSSARNLHRLDDTVLESLERLMQTAVPLNSEHVIQATSLRRHQILSLLLNFTTCDDVGQVLDALMKQHHQEQHQESSNVELTLEQVKSTLFHIVLHEFSQYQARLWNSQHPGEASTPKQKLVKKVLFANADEEQTFRKRISEFRASLCPVHPPHSASTIENRCSAQSIDAPHITTSWASASRRINSASPIVQRVSGARDVLCLSRESSEEGEIKDESNTAFSRTGMGSHCRSDHFPFWVRTRREHPSRDVESMVASRKNLLFCRKNETFKCVQANGHWLYCHDRDGKRSGLIGKTYVIRVDEPRDERLQNSDTVVCIRSTPPPTVSLERPAVPAKDLLRPLRSDIGILLSRDRETTTDESSEFGSQNEHHTPNEDRNEDRNEDPNEDPNVNRNEDPKEDRDEDPNVNSNEDPKEDHDGDTEQRAEGPCSATEAEGIGDLRNEDQSCISESYQDEDDGCGWFTRDPPTARRRFMASVSSPSSSPFTLDAPTVEQSSPSSEQVDMMRISQPAHSTDTDVRDHDGELLKAVEDKAAPGSHFLSVLATPTGKQHDRGRLTPLAAGQITTAPTSSLDVEDVEEAEEVDPWWSAAKKAKDELALGRAFMKDDGECVLTVCDHLCEQVLTRLKLEGPVDDRCFWRGVKPGTAIILNRVVQNLMAKRRRSQSRLPTPVAIEVAVRMPFLNSTQFLDQPLGVYYLDLLGVPLATLANQSKDSLLYDIFPESHAIRIIEEAQRLQVSDLVSE